MTSQITFPAFFLKGNRPAHQTEQENSVDGAEDFFAADPVPVAEGEASDRGEEAQGSYPEKGEDGTVIIHGHAEEQGLRAGPEGERFRLKGEDFRSSGKSVFRSRAKSL